MSPLSAGILAGCLWTMGMLLPPLYRSWKEVLTHGKDEG